MPVLRRGTAVGCRAVLTLLVSVCSVAYGMGVLRAPSAVVLLVGGALSSVCACACGVPWSRIERDLVENLRSVMIPCLTLLAVGVLVGSWMVSGTVPLMVYYGLSVLTPKSFLVVACLVSSLASVCTGNPWGAVSTVGIALLGVAAGLGVPLEYAAGAVVAGAIFGAKLSPLCAATVLAAAMCEVEVVDHIRGMLWVTLPAFAASVLAYAFLGTGLSRQGSAGVGEVLAALEGSFRLHPVLLLPVAAVLCLMLMKRPVLPAFFAGTALAAVLAVTVQGRTVGEVMVALDSGCRLANGVEALDRMLSWGGFESMLGSFGLIVAAMVFATPLRSSGILEAVTAAIDHFATTRRRVVLLALTSHGLLFGMLCSYYATFALMGPLFRPLFDRHGIDRRELSRALEVTGTVLAPLLPWTITGAFMTHALAVPVSQFGLYAPVCYLSAAFAAIGGMWFPRGREPVPQPAEGKEAAGREPL